MTDNGGTGCWHRDWCAYRISTEPQAVHRDITGGHSTAVRVALSYNSQRLQSFEDKPMNRTLVFSLSAMSGMAPGRMGLGRTLPNAGADLREGGSVESLSCGRTGPSFDPRVPRGFNGTIWRWGGRGWRRGSGARGRPCHPRLPAEVAHACRGHL